MYSITFQWEQMFTFRVSSKNFSRVYLRTNFNTCEQTTGDATTNNKNSNTLWFLRDYAFKSQLLPLPNILGTIILCNAKFLNPYIQKSVMQLSNLDLCCFWKRLQLFVPLCVVVKSFLLRVAFLIFRMSYQSVSSKGFKLVPI